MKKVPVLEVKRAFAISDLIKTPKGRKKFLGLVSKKAFAKRLAVAKKKVLKMNEEELDAFISPTWPRRRRAYNASEWYVVTLDIKDLGVWKRAGGMPLAWTKGSLKDTAAAFKESLEQKPKILGRARHAVPNMIASNVFERQEEKYLLPIAFKGGTGTNGRRGLKKVKADLDDGCMRSVALAVGGKKKIKLYYGVPAKK
jgi:hypothetical protein